MANLAKTLFGRLYGLNRIEHFSKYAKNETLYNGIYKEYFTLGRNNLISGELYYKYTNFGEKKDNYYYEKSFIIISIDGISDKYIEKIKQEYNKNGFINEHYIYLYENIVKYKPIEFDKIPKLLLDLLEKKDDKNIIKCSCHSK